MFHQTRLAFVTQHVDSFTCLLQTNSKVSITPRNFLEDMTVEEMVWRKLIDVSMLKIHCKKVSNIAKECKYNKMYYPFKKLNMCEFKFIY